jgi:hypothetical protein
MIILPTRRVACLIATHQKDITVELQRKRRLDPARRPSSRISEEQPPLGRAEAAPCRHPLVLNVFSLYGLFRSS